MDKHVVKSFILGVIEFRSCFTSIAADQLAYDFGRELAHRATFRVFENE